MPNIAGTRGDLDPARRRDGRCDGGSFAQQAQPTQ